MKKIGIGVLGLGNRGLAFGIREFLKLPGRAEVTALCDLDQARLDYAVAETGLTDTAQYLDLDAMLRDPAVDAVVNCTDDPDHIATSLPILAAGRHLYLEKPMAQTTADCDRIIRAWRETGVVLMIGLELRYCTLFQDVRRIIDRGDIGAIKMALVVDNVSVGGDYYFHGVDRRQEHVKSLVLEKGTHSLDLANWFIGGHPRLVYCSGGLDVFGGSEPDDKRCRDCDRRDDCPYFISSERFVLDYGAATREWPDYCVYAQEINVDDNSIVLVDYDNGARLSYAECHFTPDYTREFTFIGDQGRIVAHYDNEQNFSIEVSYRHSDKRDLYHPAKVEGAHGGGDPMIVKRFLELVAAGKACAPGVAAARDSAAIAIAAHESRQSGGPVAVPPLPELL